MHKVKCKIITNWTGTPYLSVDEMENQIREILNQSTSPLQIHFVQSSGGIDRVPDFTAIILYTTEENL